MISMTPDSKVRNTHTRQSFLPCVPELPTGEGRASSQQKERVVRIRGNLGSELKVVFQGSDRTEIGKRLQL